MILQQIAGLLDAHRSEAVAAMAEHMTTNPGELVAEVARASVYLDGLLVWLRGQECMCWFCREEAFLPPEPPEEEEDE